MAASTMETAVAEGGAYEVIRARLETQGQALAEKARQLNEARLALFGGTEMALVASTRIRTENNCVPRDIVQVGGLLLFGYNVHIGLRTETRVADVFSLQRLTETDEGLEIRPVALEGSFLDDPGFQRDFQELYQYYRESSLAHLRVLNGKLLACFNTGRGRDSVKVFRWGIQRDGTVSYIDNRGERDDVLPPAHDFEWTATTRDNHVEGRHPHVNVLDTVFVETIGGHLTIKVEDNTESGLGIYTEPVDDPHQSLADAQIQYASVGELILLKIRPYGESHWRYLVYNPRVEQVARIDAIGQSCLTLPEDHGLVFPGGCYLQSGELKRFDSRVEDLEFRRAIRSPNGEDVLYVFYHWDEGRFELMAYNLIRKELANPIVCHGFSLFDDGRVVVFRGESGEATRVHPMQVWQTPFVSDEVAAAQPVPDSFLGQIGNRDLVRGVSDAYSMHRMILDATPSVGVYEALIRATGRMLDSYHWLGHPEVGDIAGSLREIGATAELVLSEFEKVQQLRGQADRALAEARERQAEVTRNLRPESVGGVDDYVQALDGLRRQRGHVITLKDLRYVDLAALEALEAETVQRFEALSRATVDFLLRDDALSPYHRQVDELDAAVEQVDRVVDMEPLAERLGALNDGLELLNEVVTGLKISDATQRTAILERLSEVFARVNRSRATLELRRRELRSGESAAEFAVEFKLYGQNVTSALGMAETPDACEEQLSRLLIQLEELEGRFGEFDEYLSELASKREEVYEAFEARKQSLLEARQRRAANLASAAERILKGVQRRTQSAADAESLNTYLASDPMVLKLRDLVAELRGLGESVRADDLESQLKTARDQASRALRDRADIFEDGGAVIRLGKHRFSVNTQSLDLTLLPLDDGLGLYLTGTDYREPVNDPELLAARDYWDQERVSETPDVYRGEYLAASLLFAAERGEQGLSLSALRQLAAEGELEERVRRAAAERYDEGYERGVHDTDAAKILAAVLDRYEAAGLLRHGPGPRSLACWFWSRYRDPDSDPRLSLDRPVGEVAPGRRGRWQREARNLARLASVFGDTRAREALAGELAAAMGVWCEAEGIPAEPAMLAEAGGYLVQELAAETPRFVCTQTVGEWLQSFRDRLQSGGQWGELEQDLAALTPHPAHQRRLAGEWLAASLHAHPRADELRPLLPEAVARLALGDALAWGERPVEVRVTVEGLLGQHPRLENRRLVLQLDGFLARLRRFSEQRVPGYLAYRKLRQRITDTARESLRLGEFLPHPLTSFVRNRLIDEVYLPLIGDNLAKQMGTVGESRRTDLMGMLLLISPPGYGKTTLMEYVASRLGLVFMKINCPTLGHGITSIDPAEAANAAARQELEKLNLGLEMGNNVMLYLDDIQHTNPEFLQKFISLADGTRRIEGVWRGRNRTYDLRGKKFCVIMAGNPYTESGDVFKIPDMLANRADIYNLGDVLSGKEDRFALSYLENSLTANPVLAPLATRDMDDVYKLIRMARGEEISTNELSHGYAGAELSEILAVLQKLFRVQEVLLAVNQQYIRSASQADAYRTEPPFKLQGSYRNMNKLAEKIVAVMNAAELEALIDDHYQGEAQTLTTGAEENLLKLRELRGTLRGEDRERWQAIQAGYQRRQALGGEETDPATRIATPLVALGQQLQGIQQLLEQASIRQGAAREAEFARFTSTLEQLAGLLEKAEFQVQVVNQPVPGVGSAVAQLSKLVETVMVPMFSAMHNKLSLDHAIWEKLQEVERSLGALDRRLLSKGDVRWERTPIAGGE